MTTSTNPIIETTDQRVDPRPILARAMAIGGGVVASVAPDQLDHPTPCAEMDVRTMLGHLVGVLDRIAALGRGDDPFGVVERLAPDGAWAAVWADSVQAVTDAWRDDAVLDQPMALPWVEGTGADVLASYFSELTVHTWDLAVATGRSPAWDDGVVAAALANRDFLPAENRLELFTEISAAVGLDEVAIPFAEAVEIDDDAAPIDRLVAWAGRDPRA